MVRLRPATAALGLLMASAAGVGCHPVGPPIRQPSPPIVPATLPDATAEIQVIDLGVALRLAGVDNPTIALAQERIRESMAGQLAARSLLLPSLNVGGNFRLHRGAFQDDPGFLRTPNLQSLYLGAG